MDELLAIPGTRSPSCSLRALERLQAGELDPDHIHTPGIFVKRIIEVGTAKKRIEFRNTRPRPAA